MRSKKHGMQGKLVILVSATLTALLVGGVIAYLDYESKAKMIKDAKEIMVGGYVEAEKGLLGKWKFKHCTSSNNNCGRLE